jgi:hypothetical protein
MTVNGQLFAWLFIAPLRICSPITYLYVSVEMTDGSYSSARFFRPALLLLDLNCT